MNVFSRKVKVAISVVFLGIFLSFVINNRYVGLQTDEIIKQYGYPCETHDITTDDGYILRYFRIPYSPNTTKKRGSVLVMHGVIGSSATFVQLGPERGLAFVLADSGYDVWLGNMRGNGYCKNHTNLDPFWDNGKFFNFSVHEIGYYDIPAAIDYILSKTNQSKLHYVGLSLGTSVYFVFGITRPEYHSKVRLATLMAPVALLEHYPKWGLINIASQNIHLIESAMKFLHLHEIPFTDFFRILAPPICAIPVFSIVCQIGLTPSTGNWHDTRHAKEYIPVIVANSPTNTALKTLFHLGQQIKNGGFSQFDYGMTLNLKVYGTKVPPGYNLSLINTPIAAYYGKSDEIAIIEDARNTLNKLPNLVNDYLIPSTKFAHGSFVYSTEIKVLLFNKLIEIMQKY